MGFNYLLTIIAGLLSVLATGLTLKVFPETLLILLRKQKPQKSYGERLSKLTSSLIKSSSEVDNVLAELAIVAKDRERAVTAMETTLAQLENREKELKEKINILQKVPIPVAEQFARLVEPSEKRSSKRDYLLFIAGVIVTTIIAVILQAFVKI